MNIDPVLDLQVSYATCTDESGYYHIGYVWPGQNRVMAVGTCGGSDHGLVTDTLTALPGVDHTLDLTMTAGTAPLPAVC